MNSSKIGSIPQPINNDKLIDNITGSQIPFRQLIGLPLIGNLNLDLFKGESFSFRSNAPNFQAASIKIENTNSKDEIVNIKFSIILGFFGNQTSEVNLAVNFQLSKICNSRDKTPLGYNFCYARSFPPSSLFYTDKFSFSYNDEEACTGLSTYIVDIVNISKNPAFDIIANAEITASAVSVPTT